jgi:predicted TIM-barrel fold metal-dependent hydrolase
MDFIDAHAHVWTDDTVRYPLAPGHRKADMMPPSFTPADLLRHARANGVRRVHLIQMSYYCSAGDFSKIDKVFDNSYMLDALAAHKGTFTGTAVIDPGRPDVAWVMTELAKRGVRAFRIYPGLERGVRPNAGAGAGWLRAAGYDRMFAAAARNNQAMSCLINPDALADLERMCRKHPKAPVVVDHLCRIGVDGTIRDADVDRLCSLARLPRVYIKVGAFYALGKKKPPYTDLAGLIQKVVRAFGPRRCMWESDSPFQVQPGHTYRASIDLVRSRLDFLTAADREWLLRKTAEGLYFPA